MEWVWASLILQRSIWVPLCRLTMSVMLETSWRCAMKGQSNSALKPTKRGKRKPVVSHEHFLMIAMLPSGAVFVVAFDNHDTDGPKTSSHWKLPNVLQAEQRVNWSGERISRTLSGQRCWITTHWNAIVQCKRQTTIQWCKWSKPVE